MVVEKILIVCPDLNDPLGDAGEHREVAADVWLDVMRRDSTAEEQAADIARHVETHEAGLDDRINDDYLAAATADLAQCAHQPRMVARRIAADNEYTVGFFQIFEVNRRGPVSNDAGEADTAGLMAVEAAIVDIVGAVQPGKKLQKETGFVAAA